MFLVLTSPVFTPISFCWWWGWISFLRVTRAVRQKTLPNAHMCFSLATSNWHRPTHAARYVGSVMPTACVTTGLPRKNAGVCQARADICHHLSCHALVFGCQAFNSAFTSQHTLPLLATWGGLIFHWTVVDVIYRRHCGCIKTLFW